MSDVLVKGMDMPTACRNGKCNFACSAAYQTGLICIIRKQYVVPGDVPVDCPCSFVPPHGRLGDLDDLYAHLNEWYLTNNPVFTKEEALYIRAMLLGIVEAPTIIPAEAAEEGEGW